MALRRGRAPSHSLTTQASRSWPSRLTTAINPSKNQTGGPTCSRQQCARHQQPAHLSHSGTRLDSISGCEGPFSVCPDAPSTQQRGPPNCIDSLTHFSQGLQSAISWPFRALQKRPARSKCPPRATVKPDRQTQGSQRTLKRFQPAATC